MEKRFSEMSQNEQIAFAKERLEKLADEITEKQKEYSALKHEYNNVINEQRAKAMIHSCYRNGAQYFRVVDMYDDYYVRCVAFIYDPVKSIWAPPQITTFNVFGSKIGKGLFDEAEKITKDEWDSVFKICAEKMRDMTEYNELNDRCEWYHYDFLDIQKES